MRFRPIEEARLTTTSEDSFVNDTSDPANPVMDSRQWSGNPDDYIDLDTVHASLATQLGDSGIQLFLPEPNFAAINDWYFRDNLVRGKTGCVARSDRTRSSSIPTSVACWSV